jgi:hypothetical protein
VGLDANGTISELSNLIQGITRFIDSLQKTFNTTFWKKVKDNELNNILLNNLQDQFKLGPERSKYITILSDQERDFSLDC